MITCVTWPKPTLWHPVSENEAGMCAISCGLDKENHGDRFSRVNAFEVS